MVLEKNETAYFSKTFGPIKIQTNIPKPFQFEGLAWNPNPEFPRPFRWIGPDGFERVQPKYGI